jgi:ketosteroid isomerase-like protein
MSQETVALAHRTMDAFNRRDFGAFLGFMHPEVELKARFMEVEGDVYFRGHAGVREWWEALLAIFPDFRVEVIDVRDHGDYVLTHLRVQGHGLDSGVPVDEEVWQACKLRDGKVSWWRNFATQAEAQEAAGLPG